MWSIHEVLSTQLWAHITISYYHKADKYKLWHGSLHYTPFALSLCHHFVSLQLRKNSAVIRIGLRLGSLGVIKF